MKTLLLAWRHVAGLVLLGWTLWAGAAPAVEVVVDGLSADMQESVLAQLSLRREAGHPLLDAYRIRRLHRKAPLEIRTALRPFGYYQAEVEAELEEQDGNWRARYKVRLGEPVRVRALDVQISGAGADDAAFRRWKDEFPLPVGAVLEHARYEQAKRELQQLARDRGYFDARLLQHEMRVTMASASAEIVLHFDSGQRYHFGVAQFDATALDAEILQRYLTFQPGEPFHMERLWRLHRALMDSDYFDRVEAVPLPEAAVDGQVPVAVRLTMRPRTRYSYGVGYGTDTGPRLSAGMERRWVNDQGHRLLGDATVSTVLNTVELGYRIPRARPVTDYLAVNAGWEQENTDTSERETQSIGVSLTEQRAPWQRTVGLKWQQEQFTVADQEDTINLVLPSVGWQRVEADNRLFPRRGWRAALELRGSARSLGSDVSLLQGQVRGKYVRPFAGGRLIGRVDVGASETPEFERVPASLRFFAGGDNSVRGYGYKTLGPRDADGDVIGGRYLAVASLEYDRYFSERTGAAVFFDVGNAFDDEEFVPAKGAGVGLRWRLPFGVIRLDLAATVGAEEAGWRLHLTLGPDL